MSEAGAKRGGVGTGWRWLIWLAYVTAWTCALLAPVPEGDWGSVGSGEESIDLKYLFGKAVHVSAYAVLAGLAGWLRVPYRRRWLLLFFVMAHGTVTELLQLHSTTHRTGCLEDVGLDHLGVALGLLVTWKWWSEP
jgi:hypothetical protein